jgi:hypothetical protein
VLHYLHHMALVNPSPHPLSDATRRIERVHAAKVVPLKQRPDPLAACVGEAARREYVRMQLLLARAARP